MSASMVIVLYKGLLDVCDKLSKKSLESSVKETINILKHELTHRFCNLEMSNTLTMSTFLDPKFKYYALSKTVGEQIKTKIINAIALNIKNTTQISPSTTVNFVEDKNEYCIWGKFDAITSTITSQGTNTLKSIIEVNRYLEESVLIRTVDSIGWWREHSYNYPNLSNIVREKCCVVGTSVQCERVFSKAGFVLSERRNRLKPKKKNQILILNYNYKLIQL